MTAIFLFLHSEPGVARSHLIEDATQLQVRELETSEGIKRLEDWLELEMGTKWTIVNGEILPDAMAHPTQPPGTYSYLVGFFGIRKDGSVTGRSFLHQSGTPIVALYDLKSAEARCAQERGMDQVVFFGCKPLAG